MMIQYIAIFSRSLIKCGELSNQNDVRVFIKLIIIVFYLILLYT